MARKRGDHKSRLVECVLRGVGNAPSITTSRFCIETSRRGRNERQLLCDAVVQVARNAPPLFHGRTAGPVPADLIRAPDEQQEHTAQAQDVADIDPVGED